MDKEQLKEEAAACVERLNAMSKEEKLDYGKKAYRFCLEHNLFFKGKYKDELAELRKDPSKLMMSSVMRMEMFLKTKKEA